MKRSILGHIVLILFLSAACSPDENVMPKPELSVSNEFMTNWNGCLKGSALGIDPNLYYVSIYVRVEDLWESLPDKSTSVIPISIDNEWICTPVSLKVEQISEIMIFLLPNRFNSPVLDGEKSIPLKITLVSVASHRMSFKESI